MEHSSPDMTVEQICTVIDLLNPALMIIYTYMILQMTIIIFPLTQRNVFRFRELLFTMSLKITGILSMPLTLRHCRPI